MNRWFVSALAFVIGLGGSFAAVSSVNGEPTNRQGELLGPVDFDEICDTVLDGSFVPVPDSGNAFGWTCARRENGIFTTTKLGDEEQFDQICRAQYGSPTFARPWDVRNPMSWECFYGVRV